MHYLTGFWPICIAAMPSNKERRKVMTFNRATMTMVQLEEALTQARKKLHWDVHKGKVIISPEAYETPGRETNLAISSQAILDCTGSIYIGPWCMIGARSRIYTHDHLHVGKGQLLKLQEEHGIMWQDKYIGADVWIHDGSIILYQVTHIPDGVVIGAGSVLTKNPGPYEIWAGNPARKISTRTEIDKETIEGMVRKKSFSL